MDAVHHILRSCAAVLCCAMTAGILNINVFAETSCTYLKFSEDGTYEEISTVSEGDISEEGWYTRDGGQTFSYYYEDGSFASGSAVLPDGVTYLFTDDGTLKTGWQLVEGRRYYYNPENGRLSLGWVSYMNKTYYVDAEKGKLTGSSVIDGKMYNFDKFGALAEGESAGIYYDAPCYYQADERWGNVYIGTKTIAKVGCLTSCMAMMHSYYTGTEITPDVMCKEYLTYNNNSLLWAEVYNLGYEVVSLSENSNSRNLADLYERLQTGPVIVGAKNSYGGMHFVLVTGCTKDSPENLSASDFTMNDPGFERKKTLDEHFEDYGSWYQFYCKAEN